MSRRENLDKLLVRGVWTDETHCWLCNKKGLEYHPFYTFRYRLGHFPICTYCRLKLIDFGNKVITTLTDEQLKESVLKGEHFQKLLTRLLEYANYTHSTSIVNKLHGMSVLEAVVVEHSLNELKRREA